MQYGDQIRIISNTHRQFEKMTGDYRYGNYLIYLGIE